MSTWIYQFIDTIILLIKDLKLDCDQNRVKSDFLSKFCKLV